MFRIKISFEDQEAEFQCEASDTIMEAARRQGILLASYCEQGGCGACTAVMDKGSVAYIRTVKGISEQPEAGERIRPCSAVPLEDLELSPLSRWKTFSG
ncbi:MAG: 2Fe-2S iron-sulfur cluster binding domain-containing protein [Pseudomonadales bacterium]